MSALNNPWAYIGVEAGIASLLTEQTRQVFDDALQFANNAKAGYLSDAQKYQRAEDLWRSLVNGLRSDLTGLRSHLSVTAQIWADKAIDGMQAANTIDDLVATKGAGNFANAVTDLGRCLGGMVAAAQLIDSLTTNNESGDGPTANDVAKAALGIGVGLLVTALGGVSLPAILGAAIVGFAIDWAWDAYSGEVISPELKNANFWDVFFDFYTGGNVSGVVNTQYTAAQNWRPSRDPLVLDLGGDGIETVGATAGVLFDHDGDGVKTGTGWIGADDGLLVMDRDGNGTIDSGRELFGDSTPLNNDGSLDAAEGTAANGFAALAREDSNGDGLITSAYAHWSRLRVWQDANQDGISQASELKTLDALGITQIGLAYSTYSQSVGNGNTLTQSGEFIRGGVALEAGTVSQAGDLDLAEDTFHGEYADEVEVDADLAGMPDMQGSGKVRDLLQAASLDTQEGAALKAALSAFTSAATAQQRAAAVDALLAAWAATSGMQTMDQRLSSASGSGRPEYAWHWSSIGSTQEEHPDVLIGSDPDQELPESSGGYAAWLQLAEHTTQMLQTLEAFNGRYFYDFESYFAAQSQQGAIFSVSGGGTGSGSGSSHIYQPTFSLSLSTAQLESLEQAYAALRTSVSSSLYLQVVAPPLLDLIELRLDDNGISLDFSKLQAEFDRGSGQRYAQRRKRKRPVRVRDWRGRGRTARQQRQQRSAVHGRERR